VLQLQDDITGNPLPLQVVSLDGIALDGIADPSTGDTSRIDVVPCPGGSELGQSAVCANSFRMMPSTRVELWVPPTRLSTSATLAATSFSTGLDGDEWPFVELAHVTWGLQAPNSQASTVSVSGAAANLTRAGGVLAEVTARFPGLSKALHLSNAPQRKTAPAESTTNCGALAPGHHRRIYFGIPTGNPNGFGLGYEEIDQSGIPVPGTFLDLSPFDGTAISVCVPLAPGNQATTETWELVNVSREDHNFHMHQTNFQVLSGADASMQLGAMMDSVPVPHGSDSCDASIATFKSGVCAVEPVVVSIPFSQIGDFVYHCLILEHEDGGMMAHIRVVPSP
jgi:hypothetical protein